MERVQTGLRMPCDLNQRLKQEAERRGTAKNALILEILRAWDEQMCDSPCGARPRSMSGAELGREGVNA